MRAAAAVLAVGLALAGCGAHDAGEAAPAGPRQLVEELRSGGLVIYLRHGATDMSQQDVAGAPIDDCSRQRNLTERGRAQARQIGRAIRALAIAVGPVVASEYCRNLETARLAFGRAEPDRLLTGLPARGEEDYDERVARLRALLGEPPPDGTNRVVVGHVKNLEAAASVEIDEGEAAIFEPLGDGEFRLRGTVPAAVWPQLADALAEG